MPYSLVRLRDGAGDSGPMSLAIIPQHDENGKLADVKYEHNSPPIVGSVLRVGSLIGRTMQAQDWWQTTLITEILEDTTSQPERTEPVRIVKFKTRNSEYEWKEF